MNSAGIQTATDDANLSTKTVVVVGVKLDSRSRELVTWTLIKSAKPGDCVIALHVLPDSLAAGTSSLISIVRGFHSLLAVYEGLCTLKQVVLKLKVSRGDSVRNMLVKEVKAFAASKLILGISNTPKILRSSSISVARYCAVKLALTCSVLVVDDWKIVFMSKAGTNDVPAEADASLVKDNGEKLKLKNHVGAGKDTCKRGEVNAIHMGMSNSLALVPFQGPFTGSPIFGWTFIRRMFVLDRPSLPKFKLKRLPSVEVALRLPDQYSAAVYPDQKQNKSSQCEDNNSIIAIGNCSGLAPLTPYRDLSNLPKVLECLPQKYSSLCKIFSLLDILSATSNFAPEKLVGQGGSSWVYRGCLPDGKEIAVKVLKPSENSIREFVSEIKITSDVYHKNIVKLLGFSLEANYLLLVYDYLARGSLDETLHGNKKNAYVFGWKERYKVGVGVAQALTYLHNGSTEPIIHRDVKSSNILLSDDFEPQLSDFGLAQRGSASVSDIICTDIAGTFGYLAPEYFTHGKITDKIDVYAFGVVLLELISGRKSISSDSPKGQESLVMWAKPKLENGEIYDLLDPNLRLDIGCHGIERMVLAARLCIRGSPISRPQMSTILKLLQGDPEVSNMAKQLTLVSNGHEYMEDELGVPSDIQAHLNLALLDLEVDDNALSVSGTKHNVSLQACFQGRCSSASQTSFD